MVVLDSNEHTLLSTFRHFLRDGRRFLQDYDPDGNGTSIVGNQNNYNSYSYYGRGGYWNSTSASGGERQQPENRLSVFLVMTAFLFICFCTIFLAAFCERYCPADEPGRDASDGNTVASADDKNCEDPEESQQISPPKYIVRRIQSRCSSSVAAESWNKTKCYDRLLASIHRIEYSRIIVKRIIP